MSELGSGEYLSKKQNPFQGFNINCNLKKKKKTS